MTPITGQVLDTQPQPAAPAGAAGQTLRSADGFGAFRTIVGLGAIQVVVMAFNLLRSKIVAVTVGPAGVGAISLIDQVAALVAQICTFSLPYAAVKFLSAAHSEGREAFTSQYVTFLRVLVIISVLGSGVGAALLWWWPAVLGRELVTYGSVVVVALLAVPALNLTALLTNAMAAAQRLRASALYGLLIAVALAVLSGAGVVLAGLKGYYVGNLLALVGLAAGGAFWFSRREGLWAPSGRINLWREMRRYPKVLNFAAALYVISFAFPMAYLIARYALLSAHGLEATGLLQSAMALGLALTAVMRPANALFLTPALNRNEEGSKKFHKAANYLRVLALIIGIAALPLVLFPDWWLLILYSRRFLGRLRSFFCSCWLSRWNCWRESTWRC